MTWNGVYLFPTIPEKLKVTFPCSEKKRVRNSKHEGAKPRKSKPAAAVNPTPHRQPQPLFTRPALLPHCAPPILDHHGSSLGPILSPPASTIVPRIRQ